MWHGHGFIFFGILELRIKPCFPSDWQGFRVQRELRGAVYEISVTRDKSGTNKSNQVFVDGEYMPEGLVPYYCDGKPHTVEVVLVQ